MSLHNNNYVIGVDGGGTKTIAALADLTGKILKIGKFGSSSPRNVGIKVAARNIAKAIRKTLPEKKIKILSVFIGLPAVEEEFRKGTEGIRKEILKQTKISRTLKGKLAIGSDQLVAFRAGTNKKEGIVLIAGTGCVTHGWKRGREQKASGWGWLADEGSAFWIGQKVFQAVLKDLDGRGPKTLLTDFAFSKFKIKKRKANLLNQKVYSDNFIEVVSSLAFACASAAEKGDKTAKNILAETGKELALSVSATIKRLNFSKREFPLVLVGSVLKSKIVLDTLEKEIKKIAPRIKFVIPKGEPVVGAVKLALESANRQNNRVSSNLNKYTGG